MLTICEAAQLLNKCHICQDIQNKILLLFISFGTPTKNIIKSQIKCLDNSFKSPLFKRIILENDLTLWFLKLYLNKAINLNKLYIQSLRVIYELKIAYLSKSNFQEEIHINNLLEAIKINSDSDLFGMFYNLDKNKYKYLGTPTANIIHNAISNEIINEFDPMIWYEHDPDARYY